MVSIKKSAGSAVLSFALLGGLVGFSPIAGATSGYNHHNVRHHNSGSSRTSTTTIQRTRINNDNDISLDSTNYQTASSGDVQATHNTTTGSVSSGNASNNSSVSGRVEIDNTTGSAALMDAAAAVAPVISERSHGEMGGNSTVTTNTTNDLSLTNNNDVNIDVSNDQMATSGNVTVSGNTTAGNATSGSATNTSSATLNVSVSN